MVFAPSLFFCVPLLVSWLSNFHLIFIFTSFPIPFHLHLHLICQDLEKPRGSGACVWTIWGDVKLLTCCISVFQGPAGNVIVLQPTKMAMTFCDIDPGRWIDVPASIFMSSFCDGLWLTQEPPCRFSNFSNLLSINLMSLQCLYGFRNLSSCELKGKGQLPILSS